MDNAPSKPRWRNLKAQRYFYDLAYRLRKSVTTTELFENTAQKPQEFENDGFVF